jgi:hypothetical protein
MRCMPCKETNRKESHRQKSHSRNESMRLHQMSDDQMSIISDDVQVLPATAVDAVLQVKVPARGPPTRVLSLTHSQLPDLLSEHLPSTFERFVNRHTVYHIGPNCKPLTIPHNVNITGKGIPYTVRYTIYRTVYRIPYGIPYTVRRTVFHIPYGIPYTVRYTVNGIPLPYR